MSHLCQASLCNKSGRRERPDNHRMNSMSTFRWERARGRRRPRCHRRCSSTGWRQGRTKYRRPTKTTYCRTRYPRLGRSGWKPPWPCHAACLWSSFSPCWTSWRDLRFSQGRRHPQLDAPTLGEHNQSILTSYLGYSAQRIEALERGGVLYRGAR